MMLSRRFLIAASRLPRPSVRTPLAASRAQFSARKCLQARTAQSEPIPLEVEDDPAMNGGYQNPPAVKRQWRDPYADWWDKQERRNYGEPVHEDNDILGRFSLEEYTHMTAARGFLLWAGFLSTVLGLSFVVSMYYPDKPSAPIEYEDGLERELGGIGAVRAFKAGDKV